MDAKISMTPEELRNLLKDSFKQCARLTIMSLDNSANFLAAKVTQLQGKALPDDLLESLDQKAEEMSTHCIFGDEEK